MSMINTDISMINTDFTLEEIDKYLLTISNGTDAGKSNISNNFKISDFQQECG